MDVKRRLFLSAMARMAAGIAVMYSGLSWLASPAGARSRSTAGGCPRHAPPHIDLTKCQNCGSCAGACQRRPTPTIQASNNLAECGYCIHCYGYTFDDDGEGRKTGLICPYDALTRTKISGSCYEYTVNALRCQGCAACVRECVKKGKETLRLHVDPSRCLRCDVCTAHLACQHNAFILPRS